MKAKAPRLRVCVLGKDIKTLWMDIGGGAAIFFRVACGKQKGGKQRLGKIAKISWKKQNKN